MTPATRGRRGVRWRSSDAQEAAVHDAEIRDRIQELEQQQHALRAEGHPDATRVAHLEEAVDRCWDLLRQRQAHEEFGLDPDVGTSARTTGTVEGYEQ